MQENEYFKSERLIYRPFKPEDLSVYTRMCKEKSRRRWFYFQEPQCLTEAFWEKVIQENREVWSRKVNILKDDCGLAVVEKSSGRLCGFVAISKFHGKQELKEVELGYHIGEEFQGRGYGTEAAKAAVSWGLKRLKEIGAEPKIVGKAEHKNWPSRRVLKNAGFTYTGSEKYVSVYEIHA
jgi:RimJ/RimL family protein N-acetyltransferase